MKDELKMVIGFPIMYFHVTYFWKKKKILEFSEKHPKMNLKLHISSFLPHETQTLIIGWQPEKIKIVGNLTFLWTFLYNINLSIIVNYWVMSLETYFW